MTSRIRFRLSAKVNFISWCDVIKAEVYLATLGSIVRLIGMRDFQDVLLI